MTNDTSAPLPPAGWYPDPAAPAGQLRYWDGTAWTAQATPGAPAAPAVPAAAVPASVPPAPSAAHAAGHPTIQQFRHRLEKPLPAIAVATVAVIVLTCLFSGVGAYFVALMVVTLLLLIIFRPLLRRFTHTALRDDAVPVTREQFPEVYDAYHAIAATMEFPEKLPPLYLFDGVQSVTVEGLATDEPQIIGVPSAFVEKTLAQGDDTELRFILARELGHVMYGHVGRWQAIVEYIEAISLLTPSIKRVQEYTADRIASYYVPEGATSQLQFRTSPTISRRTGIRLPEAPLEKGSVPKMLRVVNFVSSAPVSPYRDEQFRRMAAEGWDVHGHVF